MNILLIQIKRIGDLVLTTPAIAAVRAKLPEADISLIVSAGTRELLPAIRGIDRAFVAHGKLADAANWFALARRKFDYSFDFTRTDRSAFLTLLSRANRRVTADHPKFRALVRALSYNELVDSPIGVMHTVDYHLSLLEPLGIRDAPRAVQLDIPAPALAAADRLLSDAGLVANEYLMLHPGSARLEKFWEPERWATVIDVAASYDLRCIVTGGKSALEQAHIAEIKTHARHPFVDLAGKVDLLTLTALIKRARLLTTVDSAPMHLAVATQTPQVALFGPTNPLHWAPRFTPALVLQAGQPAPVFEFNPKQKPAPMNLISTEQVIDAMKALLAAPQAATSVCRD
jgi:predicted lipopolysaccharide heptosyltransferase III